MVEQAEKGFECLLPIDNSLSSGDIMQSHFESASLHPEPGAFAGRLSRALRRALQRAVHGKQPPPVAARAHAQQHHDRQPAIAPSRAQHQLRAGAARDAQRIQQAVPYGHGLRTVEPATQGNRWLAVCDAVAGWQQDMTRRLHRYSGPLLADHQRPTAQGLALSATRMLLAMQQRSRHLVLDSIPVMRLPAALCLADQLEQLVIHDCDVFEWPASGGLPLNLSVLHFSRNPRLTALPGRIGKLLQLREVVVLDSPLRALPASLSQLPRLERLVLQGTDLRIVPAELGLLSRLQTLSLASNRMLTQLPITLGQLHQLRQLNLRGNPLLAALPDTLGNLTLLERLDLRDVHAMTSLPDTLGSLHNLRYLDATGMSTLAALPESIGRCASLGTLRLRDCLSLRVLPASVGQLTKLEYLDLRGCYALSDLPDTVRALPAGCRIDVPAHLLRRLAELRPATPHARERGAGSGTDWNALRQSWRARLQPYDGEYGSDALHIWLERYITAIASDAVRARRDCRRLALLVDGLCDSAVLRSRVFQRAHERYALGDLDDGGLPLNELMTLVFNERLRDPALPEDAASNLLRAEAFATLLERGSVGGSIDEAVQQLARWAPLHRYVERYSGVSEDGAHAHIAVARAWLRAG